LGGRGSWVLSLRSTPAKFSESLSQKETINKRVGGRAPVVEYFPSKCEDLGLNLHVSS
jgi:hypothetical protein